MKTGRILALLLGAFLCLGATECQTGPTGPVVVPEGEKAKELGKAKDDQIAALQKQSDEIKGQREAERKAAAKAASNFKGVLKAAEYIPAGLPKDAVVVESTLGSQRLPPDDPEETVKALERVVQIVTGQRDAALADYKKAAEEAAGARNAILTKDKEIDARQTEISRRDDRIKQLEIDKAAEAEAHRLDMQKTINAYEARMQQMKDAEAAKERRLWINVLRYGGLGLIVFGIVFIALTKGLCWQQGGLLILGGGLTIGFGLGLDVLTSQPWFPYAAGVVALIVLGGGGWCLYEMWINNKLYEKSTAAIQDLKDEAETASGKSQEAWNELAGHLRYRIGADTFLGKALKNRLVSRGINEAPEAPVTPPPAGG